MYKKRFLGSTYNESNNEENFYIENQSKIKKLSCPTENTDAACKSFVDSGLNDPMLIRNTAHKDLNGKNNTIAGFVRVNQYPQIDSQLTAKLYVDEAISNSVNESSILSIDPDEKPELDEQDFIFVNFTLTTPKSDNEIPIHI